LQELPVREFDLVVTLCQQASKGCPYLPSAKRVLHWDVPDPAEAAGSEEAVLEQFRQVREQLRRLVAELFEKDPLFALPAGSRL